MAVTVITMAITTRDATPHLRNLQRVARPRTEHPLCGAAEYLVRVAMVEVRPVNLVVKARDPRSGAAVMVVCPTSRMALGAVQILQQEHFQSIGITDSRGSAVHESDLAIEP
jgi:hypothetical protein